MEYVTYKNLDTKSDCASRTVQLPTELVTHILSYVSLSDRIIASRVCRLWREAASDPRLHSDTAWVIRDDLSRPAQAVCRGLSSSLYPSPTCLHLVLNDVEIKVSDVFSENPSGGESIDSNDCQSPEAQFWEQYGPSLRSLWLNCCEASERAFPILLRRCPRLRSLSVSSCREMLMSGRLLANEVESTGCPDKSTIQSNPSKCAVISVYKVEKESKQKGGSNSPFRKLLKCKKTGKTATKGCLTKSVTLERQNAVRDKSRICESILVKGSREGSEELDDEWTNNWGSWEEGSESLDVGEFGTLLETDSLETCASQSLEESYIDDSHSEVLKEPNDFSASSSQLLEGPLILPELKELRLASNRYLSDALFERFVALSPELESLSLSGCHLTFHQGIYRRFYPHRWDQYQQRMAAILGAAPWVAAEPMGDDSESEKDDGPISESVLTFQNVLRYFRRRKRQGGKLFRLSLGHTLVDNASLCELARDIPHGLRSLHLRACEQISSLPLPHVKDIPQESSPLEGSLENQSNWWSFLTELDMSLCPRLTDSSLKEISVHMGPKLRFLALRRCGALTDTGVSSLHHCIALEKIDISECCQVTAAGLLAGICGHNIMDPQYEKSEKKTLERASLRRLYASELSSGTGGLHVVKEMVMTMPTGITHLDLGSWSVRIEGRKISGLTDEVVAVLVSRLKSLQILRLSGADGLTDAGLMGLIDLAETNSSDGLDERPPTLGGIPHISTNPHHISLMTRAEAEIVLRAKKSGEVCKQRGWMEEKWERMMRENSDETSTSDEEGKAVSTAFCPIPQNSVVNLKGLQELDLSWCFSITDLSLKYAIRFRELRHLNLSHCLHISDVGLSFLSEYNPSLETLLLAFCPGINDAGVEYVVKGLPRLKHLDLQGCRELTDMSLELVAHNCNDLRYLDVSGCLWMSLEAAEETEQKLSPPLHSLHRRGLAPKVTHKTTAEGGEVSVQERGGDDGKSSVPKPPPAPLMNSLFSILTVYR